MLAGLLLAWLGLLRTDGSNEDPRAMQEQDGTPDT
jgi:hypothetical protein